MTNLSGIVSLEREHRMFAPMLRICTVVDALVIAMAAMHEKQLSFEHGHRHGILSRQFPTIVGLPMFDPVTALSKGLKPAKIHVMFDDESALPKGGVMVTGFEFDPISLVTPYFVDFLEVNRPWLKSAFGGDRNTWPTLFNFAFIVRNFLVHNGGRVNFDNINAPPVSWYALTYAPSDNGKRCIGIDLIMGDLIILLFEVSNELDRLGCPLPVEVAP
jgi:hypothetical protein